MIGVDKGGDRFTAVVNGAVYDRVGRMRAIGLGLD